MPITQISRHPHAEGKCIVCDRDINAGSRNTYICGTGLDDNGNSFISQEDFDSPQLVCGMECVSILQEEMDDQMDESMDGDHASALASAGFGTDEDYGYYGEE